MTSDDPYANKPSLKSEANQWHEIQFQLSVDTPVDWDKFDLKKWATYVARFTALMMAATEDEPRETDEAIKTLIMGVQVSRVSFVTDDLLHGIIDEFED